MATSEVTICNLALAHLGDDATVASISPPEGSAQAEHCALFYPIARDALLQMFPWNFATRRITAPAELTSETTVWSKAYTYPNEALNVFSVLPPSASNDFTQAYSDTFSAAYVPSLTPAPAVAFVTQPFAIESLSDGTTVVYTDVDLPEIRYVVRVTDTAKFSPLFVTALSRLLASYLAGPVIKGDSGVKMGVQQYQIFDTLMKQAAASDGNQQKENVKHYAPWIAGR